MGFERINDVNDLVAVLVDKGGFGGNNHGIGGQRWFWWTKVAVLLTIMGFERTVDKGPFWW